MLNLADFRPARNNSTDDWSAFNQLFRAAERRNIYDIYVPPGRYAIGQSIDLPYKTGSAYPRMRIRGHGVVLRAINDGTTLFRRTIPNVSPSPTDSISPTIEGFKFEGTGANGANAGTGLHYQGASQPVFNDLTFYNLRDGLRMEWCIGATVRNGNAENVLNTYIASNGDNGRIAGGVHNNSNSNSPKFIACRTRCTSSSAIGFTFLASGNVDLDNCIVEGTSADVAVKVDGQSEGGWVDIRNFRAQDFWCEFTSSLNRIMDITVQKSQVVVDGVRFGGSTGASLGAGGIAFDFRGSNRSMFVFKNMHWHVFTGMAAKWFAGDGTAGNSNRWAFKDCVIQGGEFLTDPNIWQGGTLPPITPLEDNIFGY